MSPYSSLPQSVCSALAGLSLLRSRGKACDGKQRLKQRAATSGQVMWPDALSHAKAIFLSRLGQMTGTESGLLRAAAHEKQFVVEELRPAVSRIQFGRRGVQEGGVTAGATLATG